MNKYVYIYICIYAETRTQFLEIWKVLSRQTNPTESYTPAIRGGSKNPEFDPGEDAELLQISKLPGEARNKLVICCRCSHVVAIFLGQADASRQDLESKHILEGFWRSWNRKEWSEAFCYFMIWNDVNYFYFQVGFPGSRMTLIPT